MKASTPIISVVLFLASALLVVARAHAIVGMRVFPGTLTFSDPGVTDELDLNFGRAHVSPSPGQPASETSIGSVAYSKTLTPRIAFSLGTDYQSLGAPVNADGMDNLNIGVQGLFYKNPNTETMLTAGLSATIGNTGSTAIGAPYSVLSPTLLFGRGFGDLPSALRYLRPIAVTGAVTPNISLNAAAPDSLDYALSFQYSLPYLQMFVRDIGLPAPLNNVVPLVELPMETCTSGPCAGRTIGTIDPGFVWIGHYGQVGLEATLPMNRASGHGLGFILGVGFYLDDIFPHTVGAPIFTPPMGRYS